MEKNSEIYTSCIYLLENDWHLIEIGEGAERGADLCELLWSVCPESAEIISQSTSIRWLSSGNSKLRNTGGKYSINECVIAARKICEIQFTEIYLHKLKMPHTFHRILRSRENGRVVDVVLVCMHLYIALYLYILVD